MRQKTVKGFTLIELIVVMAIFGVIMAGAMSLLQPASKVMMSSSAQENGNAVVSNVASYLENELASAEYLDIYNNDADLNGRVQNYAQYYYEGVLKSGSNPAGTVNYADGRIHAMIIRNVAGGSAVVESHVYNANFATGAVTVAEDSSATNLSAINRAYSNDYTFEIKLGSHDESTWGFVPATNTDYQRDIYGDSPTTPGSPAPANSVALSIKATTNNMINGNSYTFYKTAGIPLINVCNRQTVGGNYYVLNETPAADPTVDPPSFNITSISGTYSNTSSDPTLTNSREFQLSQSVRDNFVYTGQPLDTYVFIYSYGSEINT